MVIPPMEWPTRTTGPAPGAAASITALRSAPSWPMLPLPSADRPDRPWSRWSQKTSRCSLRSRRWKCQQSWFTVYPWQKMIVRGAVSGPLISTCSGTPSSARTVSSRPRSEPNGSSLEPARPRMRLTAIRSAATTAPAPAAAAPTTRPAAPVIRRQLTIGPPWGVPAALLCKTSPGCPRHARDAALCYSQVASREPAAEPGGDLIADGVQGVGPVLRGRLAVVTRPEQQHLVAFRGRLGPEVQHELVDGHRAGDEPPPTPGVDLDQAGRVARYALRVAKWDQAKRALTAGDVLMPGGNPRARQHLLDQNQPNAHSHRRPQPARHRTKQRGQADDATATPHQIESGLWQGQRGWSVGEVADLRPGPRCLRYGNDLAKRFELRVDGSVPRYVGAGQVGPDADDDHIAGRLRG